LLAALVIATSPAAAAPPWTQFEIIMWQPHDAKALATLRDIGVTAAKIPGARGEVTRGAFSDALAPMLVTATPFYIENIASDFYASYHRFTPGQAPNWRYEAARAAYRRNPADPAVFLREPGLADPAWGARIAARLRAHVDLLGRYAPLFYNLGDETGIADLAANWDFDFSRSSLDGMRGWLRAQYGSLAALNAEWGTQFATWQDVVPQTTDAAIARADGNLAPWSDFKAWMDIEYATAVRAGTDALHNADPAARAGLEGGQPPGWGGYDYGLLGRAVDVMEIYDLGNSLDIAHALNPDLVMLTTGFDAGPLAVRALWHDVLSGARGTVLWDDSNSVVKADGSVGPRGRDLAPVFEALRRGPGAQILASTPARDPVAILYSQASFRVSWLLDRQGEKTNWTMRDSGWEDEHDNAWRAATRTANDVLLHDLLDPDFVSDAMIETGALRRAGLKLLILPRALALSDRAAAEIAAFTARGGVVVADTPPGVFDGHGRKRATAAATGAHVLGGFTPASLAAPLLQAGIAPAFTLANAGHAITDVQVRRWNSFGVTLLSLQRDLPASGLPAPVEPTHLRLAHPAFIYDFAAGRLLAHGQDVALNLDATWPTLLAVSPTALPALPVVGPARGATGMPVRLRIGAQTTQQAARVSVTDPAGTLVKQDTATLLPGQTRFSFTPKTPGLWTVRATGVIDGQSSIAQVSVR
jgi:hypothetical protein